MPGLVGVLDVGVEDERILREDVDADAAQHAAGQAAAEFRPGLAGVGRLVDAAAGTAQVEGPGQALLVVRRRVQDLRVLRIITRSAAPTIRPSAFTSRYFVQVFPPSIVLKTPRSSFGE